MMPIQVAYFFVYALIIFVCQCFKILACSTLIVIGKIASDTDNFHMQSDAIYRLTPFLYHT